MGSKSLLIEIGCEEIPSRFVSVMTEQLRSGVVSLLERLAIPFNKEAVRVFSTYRRFAVSIDEVNLVQPDQTIEFSGPPLHISKTKEGLWSVAAQKFAEKCGCDVTDLFIKKDAKDRDILAYETIEKGRLTSHCLSEELPLLLTSFHLPISMKWGAGEWTFIRPVHWILALLGEETIPFSVFNCTASNKTQGHRMFSDQKWITISSPGHYESELRRACVLVSDHERKEFILNGLEQHTTQYDEELLDEVVNLVEWPHLLQGNIDKKYFQLPDYVITESMKKHQKYFPFFQDKVLTESFLIVGDNVTSSNEATIIKGNERVLTARLEDALFFFNEDFKTPLIHNVEKLKRIIYQKGLGSIYDKKERIKQLSHYINDVAALGLSPSDIDLASDLCKADLVSHMVFEFPELQGKIGARYAESQGISPDVSLAILEHYLPSQAGGTLPTHVLGVVIGIADRIDSMVASFFNNQIPTGSKDPLAIRRAVYTLLDLCEGHGLSLNIRDLVQKGFSLFGEEKNRDALDTFFMQRLSYYLEEHGFSYDEAHSVLDHCYTNILHYNSVKSIFDARGTDSFKVLVETAVRVKRLSKTEENNAEVDPKLFKEPIESELWDTFNALDHHNVFGLNDVLPRYFDKVLVMDEDLAVRKNRLSQLKGIHDWYQSFLDFEKIKV